MAPPPRSPFPTPTWLAKSSSRSHPLPLSKASFTLNGQTLFVFCAIHGIIAFEDLYFLKALLTKADEVMLYTFFTNPAVYCSKAHFTLLLGFSGNQPFFSALKSFSVELLANSPAPLLLPITRNHTHKYWEGQMLLRQPDCHLTPRTRSLLFMRGILVSSACLHNRRIHIDSNPG